MPNGSSENYLRPAKPAGKPFRGFNKPARKKLRKVSKAHAKRLKTYSMLRKEFLALHPFCAVDIAIGGGLKCAVIKSTEIHHKRGRGKFMLDTSTWAAVSREGHLWIHRYPAEAEKLGLLDPDRNKR